MRANIEKAIASTVPFPPQLSRLTFGEFAMARLRVELEMECAVCGHVRRLDPDHEALRHQTIASRSHRCAVILDNGEACRGTGFARIRRRWCTVLAVPLSPPASQRCRRSLVAGAERRAALLAGTSLETISWRGPPQVATFVAPEAGALNPQPFQRGHPMVCAFL